jgi:hypothetical protein
MVAPRVVDGPWTRRHDDPRRPLLQQVPTIAYPANLADLVEVCSSRRPEERITAAGSHWALSEAAIADSVFVETHDPRGRFPAMDRTLRDVVPPALSQDAISRLLEPSWVAEHGALVHVEAGKRIHDAYAELDQVEDPGDVSTLPGLLVQLLGVDPAKVEHLRGPWGFRTLGGAGGQTVVGAFSTGTHGGDFDRGPVADSVLALHLVGDGGRQLWIEPQESVFGQLTDDDALQRVYPGIEILRDGNAFDAALVACGRFGVIYSAVLHVERQYSLYERCRLHVWQDVRSQVRDREGPLFVDSETSAPGAANRFLQVVVCLTPHAGFSRNLVGVTKRWPVPLGAYPGGPAERIGVETVDPLTGRRRFDRAGASFPYTADPNNPARSENPSFLDRACSHASFLGGVLEEALEELEEFVSSNGAVVGAGIGAIAVAGGGALLALIPLLALVALVVKALLDALDSDDRLGEYMDKIRGSLLDPNEPDPARRAANLFVWQLIAYKIFESMQGDAQFGARSYAVMDRKNYLDISCEHNVASVEVFFDHADSRLIAFVDALIAFEINQELQGKAFLGYASLRFTGPTRALIGMQRHGTTCAVEVAGLADVEGSRELVDYATQLALNPNVGGILHWGQGNTATDADIERLFGGPGPGTPIERWRQAAGLVTNGSDAFSSAFTRRVGLEP